MYTVLSVVVAVVACVCLCDASRSFALRKHREHRPHKQHHSHEQDGEDVDLPSIIETAVVRFCCGVTLNTPWYINSFHLQALQNSVSL
ncbi:hypothetical protein ElyMa_001360600 [Elysia marginata]|uniref:Secreted protein n=1 Tax=Elysia marginata TaxID=1093978 RepID=A0AAV4ISL9_9GAST|nr:hypothetical protein ElyMa_001360600 [Elysia marginata]